MRGWERTFQGLFVLGLLLTCSDAGQSRKKGPKLGDFNDCPACLGAGFVWDFEQSSCVEALSNAHSVGKVTSMKCSAAQDCDPEGDCTSNEEIYKELKTFINSVQEWDGTADQEAQLPQCWDAERMRIKGNDANWAERHIASDELRGAWEYAWSLPPYTCEKIAAQISFLNRIPLSAWPRCAEFDHANFNDVSDEEVTKLIHAAKVMEAYVEFKGALAEPHLVTSEPGRRAGPLETEFAQAMKKLNDGLADEFDDLYMKVFALFVAAGCGNDDMFESFQKWSEISKARIDSLVERLREAPADLNKATLLDLKKESEKLNHLCLAISEKVYKYSSRSAAKGIEFWRGCFQYAFHDVPDARSLDRYENIKKFIDERLAVIESEERKANAQMKKQEERDAVERNKNEYKQMLVNIRNFQAKSGKEWFMKYRCMEVYIFAMQTIEKVPKEVMEERQSYFRKAVEDNVTGGVRVDCGAFTDAQEIKDNPSWESFF